MRPDDSVTGTRWTRCTPDFEFQLGVGALAFDSQHYFLDTAEIGLGKRQQFRLPALKLRIACVHLQKIGRKQRRLLPAGAGANFNDGRRRIRHILRQQQQFHVVLQADEALAQMFFLVRRKRFKIRVCLGIGQQGFRLA